MRIAVFSDTHGNSLALDAVLADIEVIGEVDGVWFLGDAAPIGFDPVGTVDGVRIHNLGSVSVPFTSDRRAMWTLLEADEDGNRLERRYVEYDIPAMLAALVEVGHPAESFIRGMWGAS